MRRIGLLLAVAVALLPGWAQAQTPTCPSGPPCQGGPVPPPLPVFPSSNWWNLDISAAPVDPNSANYISFVGNTRPVHPDFGGTDVFPTTFGIPYVVVTGAEAKRTVQFEVPDESDGVDHSTETSVPFYPIPNLAITSPQWVEQGWPANEFHSGDRHLLIVDQTNHHLYELYNAFYDTATGTWNAYSGAFFDMNTNNRRPEGWTSADAAGLAIFPGLIRYDEAYAAGLPVTTPIRHAFRVTVRATNGHVFPASHTAGSTSGALPMGARLRLKATKVVVSADPGVQRIVQALKTYGVIVADNGSDLYVSGTFDDRWDNGILNPALGQIKGSDFEVIQLAYNPPSCPVPQLSVNDVTVTEGTGSGGTAAFTVSLSPAIIAPCPSATVTYQSANGTAAAGSDYTAVSGTLTFATGQTTKTVNVSLAGDAIDENNETSFLNLSAPANATIADAQGVATITDDDAPPTVSVDDCVVTEGNTGSTPCSFHVTLSAPSGKTITVLYATAPGTATLATDYTTVSGGLSFAPGETTKTVSVSVVGDVTDENDETFFLNLTSPVNASLADAQGLGTILDDDAPPSMAIDDCAVTEGNLGAVPCSFHVTLSGPTGKTVTASYATANGTATAGSDYTAASAPLIFAPGETTKTVDVLVTGDTAAEVDENFVVNLSGVTNATVTDGQGQGTILDDDAPPLTSLELEHGSAQMADLAAQPGPVADADYYGIAQEARASYEVVVDATSGDIGPTAIVERVGSDNVTVVQAGTPVGTGSSVSLRWENLVPARVMGEHIRVRSAGCTTTCGPEDVYRIRFYETTVSIPRFNNSGTQVTVVVLQNPASYPVDGRVRFWGASGALLHTATFTLAARGLFTMNTSSVAALQGLAGTMTVSSNARYGDLAGKAVSLEPATGFSFDSPLSSHPR